MQRSTPRDPGDPCPDCGRPTETVTEENYYFRLSDYRQKLLDLYEKHPGFVQPETRRNEVPDAGGDSPAFSTR